MVDIVQEHVESLHALAQPALKLSPFICRKDSGYKIERNRAFGPVAVAVDRESDPDPAKQQFRLLASGRDGLVWLAAQPGGESSVMSAQALGIAEFLRAAIQATLDHFVESLHGNCVDHLDTFYDPDSIAG